MHALAESTDPLPVVDNNLEEGTETTRDGSDAETFADLVQDPISEEEVKQLFDKEEDQGAQSLEIGLDMAQRINTMRELFGKPTLTWEDKWFTIANEEVYHLANGVNIVYWETRDKIFADMNYQ